MKFHKSVSEVEKRRYFKKLRKLGVTQNRKSRNSVTYTLEVDNSHRELYPSMEEAGYTPGWKDEDYKQEVSSKYVVGQAYNKSGFQVLSRKEQLDPKTGKRR